MPTDRYGLALSTGSAAARDAYVQACDLALTLYPGAVGAYDRAIAHDPGFALAHAGKAQVLMREGNVVAAGSALAAAKQAAAELLEREASQARGSYSPDGGTGAGGALSVRFLPADAGARLRGIRTGGFLHRDRGLGTARRRKRTHWRQPRAA